MSVAVQSAHTVLPAARDSPLKRSSRGISIKGRTAQIVNGKLVLVDPPRKRARTAEEASDESGDDDAGAHQHPQAGGEAVPVASTSRASTPATTKPPLKRRQTRYYCTWEGCSKSYGKPVRLTEHMRSHTGERPFVCAHPGCGASYLRDTHLAAHMRTHLDDSDKPFACTVEECNKAFWTNQHLNRHVKMVHELNKGAYKCDRCDEAFNKHNKLREHFSKVHMPAGTRSFICPVAGCDKSFDTGSKLRTHSKVHDDNRYICMHPSHFPPNTSEHDSAAEETDAEGTEGAASARQPPKFATWSALQEHNKVAHPPTCPHAECDGKTFKSNKRLKKHLVKVHLDAPEQTEEETSGTEQVEEQADEQYAPFPTQIAMEDASFDQSAPEPAPTPIPGIAAYPDYSETEDTTQATSQVRRPTSCLRSSAFTPGQLITYQSFDGIGDYANEEDEPLKASASEVGNVDMSAKLVRFE